MIEQIVLSKRDTSILKGIAILLMLWHHLFTQERASLYDDFFIELNGSQYGIAQIIGVCGKLCVSIFVFLSGYGLAVSTNKNDTLSWKSFYKRRLLKLYPTYWLIWIIFVPISVFVFGRTFDEVYHGSVVKMILDIFGLVNVFGWFGYNPTWWFYSCIIILYALFPIMFKMSKTHLLTLVMLCFVVSLGLIPFTGCFSGYIISFMIGIICANTLSNNNLPPPRKIKCIKAIDSTICNGYHTLDTPIFKV